MSGGASSADEPFTVQGAAAARANGTKLTSAPTEPKHVNVDGDTKPTIVRTPVPAQSSSMRDSESPKPAPRPIGAIFTTDPDYSNPTTRFVRVDGILPTDMAPPNGIVHRVLELSLIHI